MKLASILYLASAAAAAAQSACPSPNPNLNAPPFVSNCPLPAAALNRLVSSGVPSGIYPAASFGAKCDGASDDTSALQAGIVAIGAAGGGVLQLPTGQTCLTSATLHVGNGSTGQGSNYNNVVVSSATIAGINGLLGIGNKATTIEYTGAGHAMEIDGPLQGWGVNGISIVCTQPTGTTGLYVQSAQYGVSSGISVDSCFNGIYSTTVSALPPGFGNADSLHNVYRSMVFRIPDVSGATGITLTGHTVADTDYNILSNVFIVCAGSVNPTSAIIFQAAESSVIEDFHVTCGGTTAPFTFDYTVNDVWPDGITLIDADPGGNFVPQFKNVGTPASVGAAPNFLIALTETNGGRYPNPPLANLLTDHGPLPTSCVSLSAGAIYNNSGTVALCP